MQIWIAASADELDQVKNLFRQYFTWVSQEHGIDLGFQGIEAELNSLPGAFASPAGCLLLAEMDGCLAGCVALRPLTQDVCEMKRMYVLPEFRGKGVGKALGERIIQEAKNRRYHAIRLDTADTMHSAQGLYRSLGFIPVQRYYELPADVAKRAVFMELAL